jgi:hypothetical protein
MRFSYNFEYLIFHKILFLLALRSPRIRIWRPVCQLVVDFILTCEKCLCCLYNFSAVSLYNSHFIERHFWFDGRFDIQRWNILPIPKTRRKSLKTLLGFSAWSTSLCFRGRFVFSEVELCALLKCQWIRQAHTGSRNDSTQREWFPSFQSRDERIGSRWTLLVSWECGFRPQFISWLIVDFISLCGRFCIIFMFG